MFKTHDEDVDNPGEMPRRRGMRPNLFFSAFEPLWETSEMCDICNASPPIFSYEFGTDGTRAVKDKKGFCCAHCTTILLHTLGLDESQKGAEGEAVLQADASDVSDFRQHRLASFKDGIDY